MNNWRGNLHPRGGDSDHPGRFSKGHGGRHYNPPPGLEHLAMHQPAPASPCQTESPTLSTVRLWIAPA